MGDTVDRAEGYTFVVPSIVSAIDRAEIAVALSAVLGEPIHVTCDEISVDQNLEFAETLKLVAAIAGIASFVAQQWKGRRKWTFDAVSKEIEEAAARHVGTADIQGLRYEGLDAFLDGAASVCKVIVTVDDEDYVFYLHRHGKTAIMKLENNLS